MEAVVDDVVVNTHDNPTVAVEQRHGWLIPLAWEFVSEVWEYERKPISEIEYDHEGKIGILR